MSIAVDSFFKSFKPFEMAESCMDFGELSNDENFKQGMIDFRKSAESASKMLERFFEVYNYDELSTEDKVRYNLFLAFAINSYFWMYLKIRGVNPNEHDIKEQINRVKEYMNRSNKIYEKKTMMPRIDQGAADRFIRSGLWTPPNLKTAESHSSEPESKVSLKRKRNDSQD